MAHIAPSCTNLQPLCSEHMHNNHTILANTLWSGRFAANNGRILVYCWNRFYARLVNSWNAIVSGQRRQNVEQLILYARRIPQQLITIFWHLFGFRQSSKSQTPKLLLYFVLYNGIDILQNMPEELWQQIALKWWRLFVLLLV